MKSLLPLLILINCHTIQGVLEWMVIEKVTHYGQNVTLFCNVSNCCPKYAGWDMWTPKQRTLFIDIKTARANKKYDGRISKDGYTLIIQKLNKQDLNISYSCVYGVTLGERKVLLEEDVFIYISTTQPFGNRRLSSGVLAAIITGSIGLLLLLLTISIYIWRRKNYTNSIRNKGISICMSSNQDSNNI